MEHSRGNCVSKDLGTGLFQLYKYLVKECILYNAGIFCVGRNSDLCHYRTLVKNSSSIFRNVHGVIEQSERLERLV